MGVPEVVRVLPVIEVLTLLWVSVVGTYGSMGTAGNLGACGNVKGIVITYGTLVGCVTFFIGRGKAGLDFLYNLLLLSNGRPKYPGIRHRSRHERF